MDLTEHPAPTTEGEPIAPRILPRPQHILSRKDIDPNALKVLYRLHNHGFRAYLVGGGVRDLLLRKTPKDFDIVTDARPNRVKKLFHNSRIIGRRFRLAHILFHGGQVIEVSTFRKKSEFAPTTADSPVVRSENTFGTPAEDASRRDLTINGLFYNIADFSILDYVGGLEDLERGIVRLIGDAEERLCEDPVRMIRAIRHAARTGFAIDPVALEVIIRKKDLIRDCAPARVREEFMRELRGGWAVLSFERMIRTELLYALFPAYHPALECEQGERTRAHLMSNLAGLDRIVSRGTAISDQELMAAFTSPLQEALGIFANLPPGRKAIGRVNAGIRDKVKPLLREAEFSRGNAEGVCHMLFALFLLRRALRHGALPKSLTNKNYFGPGLRLYQIEAAGRGENTPGMFLNAARENNIELLVKPGKSRRKRRPRRKGRPQKDTPENT